MEDATLVKIEASLVRTCAANEFVGANEQV